MSVIEQIQQHAQSIARGDEQVKPGQPVSFTDACTVNDAIAQGDFILVVAEDVVPAGYSLMKNPSLQLVPGNNVGSKHCLDSLEGVEVYLPEGYSEESLKGPFLRLSQDRVVTHPVHGDVSIPAGFAVNCIYQREYDSELAAERRARD